MRNIQLVLIGVGDDGNPNGLSSSAYNNLQSGAKKAGTAKKVFGGISKISPSLSAIPVVGPIASAVGGIIGGVGGAISGAIQKKKEQGMAPGEQDPAQMAMVNRLRRLRETYQTGSEASEYRDTLNRGLSAKFKTIGQQSGGGTGQIMSNIVSAQDNEQGAYNQILATLEKNRFGVLGLENEGVNNTAQRALDVQNMKYNQGLASAYGNIKTGTANAYAGGENLISGLLSPDFMKLLHPNNTATPGTTGAPGGETGGSPDADNVLNYQSNFPESVQATPTGS